MRHALIRLWRLVGVDVKWFVPEGHPAIFAVTKKKFHNVLQGVNKPVVKLHDTEKTMFEKWTEGAFLVFFSPDPSLPLPLILSPLSRTSLTGIGSGADGALLFSLMLSANLETFWSEGAIDSRIIVIDDPQRASLPSLPSHTSSSSSPSALPGFTTDLLLPSYTFLFKKSPPSSLSSALDTPAPRSSSAPTYRSIQNSSTTLRRTTCTGTFGSTCGGSSRSRISSLLFVFTSFPLHPPFSFWKILPLLSPCLD